MWPPFRRFKNPDFSIHPRDTGPVTGGHSAPAGRPINSRWHRGPTIGGVHAADNTAEPRPAKRMDDDRRTDVPTCVAALKPRTRPSSPRSSHSPRSTGSRRILHRHAKAKLRQDRLALWRLFKEVSRSSQVGRDEGIYASPQTVPASACFWHAVTVTGLKASSNHLVRPVFFRACW
jgi:hypothetical protein